MHWCPHNRQGRILGGILCFFHPFIEDTSVRIIGVEAGGRGIDLGPDAHAAPLTAGSVGVLHGNRTYLMENESGQIIEGHSISAGLDYPGVGPEHAYLKSGVCCNNR